MSKIMVVEDDASLREIYGIRIAADGYEVVSAGDGEEALAMAVREKPDLILSDVMMPKISGFDMLDILRSTPETAKIKIIMMTALSGDDQRQRGERLGADRYLVKSQVGIEDVVNMIHEVLGDREAPAAPATDTAAADPATMPTPGFASAVSTATAPALSDNTAAPVQQATAAEEAPAAPEAGTHAGVTITPPSNLAAASPTAAPGLAPAAPATPAAPPLAPTPESPNIESPAPGSAS